MNTKQVVAGVALLGTIVIGLAGLRGEVGGPPRAAHADAPVPTVTMSTTYGDPLSAEASGIGFTPGGAVHIDLVLAYWQPEPTPTRDPADPNQSPIPVPTLSPYNEGEPEIVASADTWAARPRTVPNGHGLVFHRAGGYFDETLASLTPNCGSFSY